MRAAGLHCTIICEASCLQQTIVARQFSNRTGLVKRLVKTKLSAHIVRGSAVSELELDETTLNEDTS